MALGLVRVYESRSSQFVTYYFFPRHKGEGGSVILVNIGIYNGQEKGETIIF